MKKLLLYIIIPALAQSAAGQQIYCDFEGIKLFNFAEVNGKLDSMFNNPKVNSIDSSAHCAKYIRANILYDNFKLYPNTKLQDVTAYADSSSSAPKLKLKLYTSAPIGTNIELQLGIRSDDNYPTGIHSEYTAKTTTRNQWENITFTYFQSPSGSTVKATEIDKIVFLFHAGSTIQDTIYIDDIVGPELTNIDAGIPVVPNQATFKLYQNTPNPSKENTHCNFQLSSSGKVSLKLYDLIGNQIYSIIDQNMKSGVYSVPVTTENLPSGIYFCVLQKEGLSQSTKMVVSK